MNRNQIEIRRLSVSLMMGLILGCSSSKKGNCGSSPTAILGRADLLGTESGFLGGFIKLRNGRECSVVLDVISPGPYVILNAWTSAHCKASLSKEKLSFDLRIYGNGGYYPTVAWATEERIQESLYGTLDKIGTRKAFQDTFASKFYVNSGSLPNDAQADCVKGDFSQTFCATLGDTTVYDLVIDPGVDPDLFQILSTAREKRDQVRAAASRASGVEKQAYDFSNTLIDYWRNKKFFYFAPMVELWHVCSSPTLKKKFLQDAESKNASFASFQNAFNSSKADFSNASSVGDFDFSNAKFSTTPATIDFNSKTPSTSSGSNPFVVQSQSNKGEGWQEEVFSFWNKVDVTLFMKSCEVAAEVLKGLKSANVFEKTLWDDMVAAGIVNGDAPAENSSLRAYTAYVIAQETKLREKLLADWSTLADQLLSPEKQADLFVSTNVVLPKAPPSASLSDSKDDWQFSVFSMGSKLMADSKPEKLLSGFKFKRDSKAQLTFKEGDSGSLFSYNNQFPLLTLNSVDGSGTSGGSAVLPTPRDPNLSAEESVTAPSNRTQSQSAPQSQSSQTNPVAPRNNTTPAQGQQNQSAAKSPVTTSGSGPKEMEPIQGVSRRTNSSSDEQYEVDASPRDRSLSWSSTSEPIPGAEAPSYGGGENSCF